MSRWVVRALQVLTLLAIGGSLALGCARNSSEPEFVPQRLIDAEPAWSHDGSKIAFVRFTPSSLGPAGLYLMSYPGLGCRLIRAFHPDGFGEPRFTADDSRLTAGWAGSLVQFDLSTGNFDYIFVNTSAALLPDLSHDGMTLAYVRPLGAGQGSLWQYHPATHDDSPILIDGQVSYGSYPRWSEDDSLLVYIEVDGIHLMRRSTGQGTRITSSDYPRNYHSVPRWLDSRRILFNEVNSRDPERYFIVDRVDKSLVLVPDGIGSSEAISPGGDSIIVLGSDRSDPALTRIVLFVRGIDSPASTARQITWFVPPVVE